MLRGRSGSAASTGTPQLRTNAKHAVEIRGLTKCFGSGDGVDGLDLTIPRGTKFGLLGPNGAGKSTTLKMLMGMLTPDRGSVDVLGQPAPHRHPQLRAHIGYVPERHHIYRWMCVGEVLAFTRTFYPTWNDGVCEQLRAQYGLDVNKRVDQLSHGMTTKLALILALAHEPELLILDEPTTGLDPLVREEFLEGILHPLVAKTARTVLFSSHILSDIESVCDTVGILHRGNLLACAPRAELVAKTKCVTLEVEGPADNLELPAGAIRIQQDGSRIVITWANFDAAQSEWLRAQPDVRSVEVHDMNLEDIFKDYIRGAEPQP